MVIDKFEGEYEFLSNFYPSRILYDKDENWYAPTVEHAFQAMKTRNMEEEIGILSAPTPGKAKRLGRICDLRPDWEEVKDDVMYRFLKEKFFNFELRYKLLATGDATLIEGTTWHDNYWGVCSCEKCGGRGKNRLGELLMKLREELRESELSF